MLQREPSCSSKSSTSAKPLLELRVSLGVGPLLLTPARRQPDELVTKTLLCSTQRAVVISLDPCCRPEPVHDQSHSPSAHSSSADSLSASFCSRRDHSTALNTHSFVALGQPGGVPVFWSSVRGKDEGEKVLTLHARRVSEHRDLLAGSQM